MKVHTHTFTHIEVDLESEEEFLFTGKSGIRDREESAFIARVVISVDEDGASVHLRGPGRRRSDGSRLVVWRTFDNVPPEVLPESVNDAIRRSLAQLLLKTWGNRPGQPVSGPWWHAVGTKSRP